MQNIILICKNNIFFAPCTFHILHKFYIFINNINAKSSMKMGQSINDFEELCQVW